MPNSRLKKVLHLGKSGSGCGCYSRLDNSAGAKVEESVPEPLT